jgi:hypothetical protein
MQASVVIHGVFSDVGLLSYSVMYSSTQIPAFRRNIMFLSTGRKFGSGN